MMDDGDPADDGYATDGMSQPANPVADVAASIEWYRRVSGFQPRVVNPPGEVPVYLELRRLSVLDKPWGRDAL